MLKKIHSLKIIWLFVLFFLIALLYGPQNESSLRDSMTFFQYLGKKIFLAFVFSITICANICLISWFDKIASKIWEEKTKMMIFGVLLIISFFQFCRDDFHDLLDITEICRSTYDDIYERLVYVLDFNCVLGFMGKIFRYSFSGSILALLLISPLIRIKQKQ